MKKASQRALFCFIVLLFNSCKKPKDCAPFTLSEKLLGTYVSDTLYYQFDYASTPFIDTDTFYYIPETLSITKGECGDILLVNGTAYIVSETDSSLLCQDIINPSGLHSSGSCMRSIGTDSIYRSWGGWGPGYNSSSRRISVKQH